MLRGTTRYAAHVGSAWSLYFHHGKLLRNALGPLLMRAGQFLLIAAAAGFFGFVLWLVLSHP